MTTSIATLAAALERAGLLQESRGALPTAVTSITDDSRAIGPGTLFIAVRGSTRDGHEFLEQAAAAGATAVIVEDASRTTLPALVVRQGESRRAAAIAAAAAYGEPARELRLIGVTGTNGKTTTVNMLRHLLDGDGGRAASIGTLGVLVGSEGEAIEGGSGLTTPGPVELQRLLRELRTAGVRTVAMEVSSHSLHQRRVEGVKFDAAVFTNLTRDHLDYHKTMEAYFDAKALLASQVGLQGALVLNEDDEAWRALPRRGRRIGYSVSNARADVHAADVRYDARGTSLILVAGDDRLATRVPLIGDFNVANALGAAAAAWGVGLAPAEIATRLATLPQVPGRLEVIHEGPTVLRDYAHTPDALERALRAVRPFARGRLIVLFGAGGDRDRGKRPQMGEIAERLADLAIVTSDNPRTEDPERILDDIEGGMKGANRARIVDRREAIAHALAMASEQDVVLLAGKGHETYQVRGTEKLPFDERLIVRELADAGRSS
ncbi:MAG: UDP-N-acetylmuramoyl-L-alanyl-D-glutamate--2,6-diaminopimelate ligase [Gemmatimonadetes bacterium]|nr:UDP-N-acetylmuramoyl-L-alanyl-D-glutamate--2,6-diaminopimelate ligase [Gemmatimonadota bacterium]